MKRARYLTGVLALATIMLSGASGAWALPAAPSSKFQPAQACGCHGGLLEQWSVSMHAKALSDPAYLLKRNKAEQASKGLGTFCDTCHGPVAVMSGEVGSANISPQSSQGVVCDFCHQVTGTTDPPRNTSQTLTLDGVKRAQLKDAQPPTHAWAYSELHEKSEFCGSCHNVDHPVNGMHLELTYTEWKDSPYAKEGVTCQDCHMTPGPGVTKPNPGLAAAGGPQREHIYTMTFAGANVGQGDARRATANLKAAATVKLETAQIVDPGESVPVSVTITNVGAGHYLPTGLTEIRQMWLEVSAVSEDGVKTVIGRRDFGTVLKDEKGKSPVELWEAAGVASDDRIPPRESVVASYTFEMKTDAPAKIEAVLNYKSLPDDMATEAGVDNPVTEMARSEQTIWPSEAARDTASKKDANPSGDRDGGSYLLVAAVAGAALLIAAGAFALMRSRKKA